MRHLVRATIQLGVGQRTAVAGDRAIGSGVDSACRVNQEHSVSVVHAAAGAGASSSTRSSVVSSGRRSIGSEASAAMPAKQRIKCRIQRAIVDCRTDTRVVIAFQIPAALLLDHVEEQIEMQRPLGIPTR